MPTRKNRPVLYEVLRARGQRGPELSRRRAPVLPIGRPSPRAAPAPEEAVQTPAPGSYPPVIRSVGDHVQMTLSTPLAIVLGVALLVVVLAVFQVGRLSSGPSTPAERVELPALRADERKPGPATPPLPPPPAAREREPAPPVVAVPRQPSPAPTETPTELSPRPTPAQADDAALDEFRPQKGWTYIVVQHFRKDQIAAARDAKAFLNERGIPTAVTRRGTEFVLVCTQGFQIEPKGAGRREQEKAAVALKDQIRKLGREEYSRRGGYAFDQAYLELAKQGAEGPRG